MERCIFGKQNVSSVVFCVPCSYFLSQTCSAQFWATSMLPHISAIVLFIYLFIILNT